MGHEPGQDYVFPSARGEQILQVGAGEGIGQSFLDHRLVGPRRKRRYDLPALIVAVEQTAWFAFVRDVEDRRAIFARLPQ